MLLVAVHILLLLLLVVLLLLHGLLYDERGVPLLRYDAHLRVVIAVHGSLLALGAFLGVEVE